MQTLEVGAHDEEEAERDLRPLATAQERRVQAERQRRLLRLVEVGLFEPGEGVSLSNRVGK